MKLKILPVVLRVNIDITLNYQFITIEYQTYINLNVNRVIMSNIN